MSKFGRMPKYHQPRHQQMEWELYKERMDQFFEANAIEDADASELDLETRKVENLLTCIGPTVYKKLRDFCDPVLPKEKTYEELCLILKSQFTPQISVYKERKAFYDARQKQGEFVNQWFIRIKSLAVNCEFNERLNNMLQDKFVTGLTRGNILDRLCEIDPTTTTLDECVNLALQQEAAMQRSVMQMRMPRNGYDRGPSHSHYQGAAAFMSGMVSNKQRGYTVAQQPVKTTQGFKASQSQSNQTMGQRGYTVAQQPVKTTQGYKASQSRSDQAMGQSGDTVVQQPVKTAQGYKASQSRSDQAVGQSGDTVVQQPVKTTQGFKASQSRSDQAMGSRKQCFACGKTKHDFKNCIFKSYTCTDCGILGHIVDACKNNKNLPLDT